MDLELEIWLLDCSILSVNRKINNNAIIYRHDIIVKLFQHHRIVLLSLDIMIGFEIKITFIYKEFD